MFFNLVKDKYLRIIGGLSLLILSLAAAIFYLKLGSTTTPLIVHFEAGKGVDFLAGRLEVFGILISGLFIILINLFLAGFLYFRERFLSYIFTFIGLLVSVLILIAIAVIINVN
jgi:hypothetical protein